VQLRKKKLERNGMKGEKSGVGQSWIKST